MTDIPPPITWVNRHERVPDSHRRMLVLATNLLAMLPGHVGDCWLVSRYNRSHVLGLGRFECEGSLWWPMRVTHWADVDTP